VWVGIFKCFKNMYDFYPSDNYRLRYGRFSEKNVCFEMYDVIASSLFTQWRHSVASLIVIVISQFYEETATWNLAWLLRYYFFTIIAEFREAILFFGHSVINIDRRQVRSWVMVYIHQAEHFP
jgi:hypothetical protein